MFVMNFFVCLLVKGDHAGCMNLRRGQCDEMCANRQVAYIKLDRNIIYNEFALSKVENLLLEQAHLEMIYSAINLPKW